MSRYFLNEKNAFPFLFCIVFGGILSVAEPVFGSVPAGRTGHPLSASEIAAYEEQKALEVYEKRNAEIDSWIEDNSIPDHNNAALFYYQALLLKPDHDQTVINKLHDVYWDTEPDSQTKIFLGEWLPSMKVSEIASRISECTWGVWPERMWPEDKTSHILLINSFRHLSYVIAVDGITLSSEGHCRAALERCMTIRRIARHLSHSTQLCISSSACDGMALRTIQRILGDMPLDIDILTWLHDQLAIFQEAPSCLERTLHEYLKAKTEMVRSSSIPKLRGMLLKRAADERARQYILNLTDDQIRHQALETVQSFFGSIFAILYSDKSADQKYTEIQKTTEYTINQDAIEPFTKMYYEFGEHISNLMTGTGIDLTEEQKLSEIQKVVDKCSEPNAVELLTRAANAVGKEIDFGFLVNREMTDEQKLVKMQKVVYALGEAFAVETSKFEFHWNAICRLFESALGHKAHINGLKAASELYLIVAKTGYLPKELPDDLPKDPYTGRHFLYETTDDGFVLICRSDVFKTGNTRFTFHVRKNGN